MNILFVADIYGSPGRRAVRDLMPEIVTSMGIPCLVDSSRAVSSASRQSGQRNRGVTHRSRCAVVVCGVERCMENRRVRDDVPQRGVQPFDVERAGHLDDRAYAIRAGRAPLLETSDALLL